MNKLLFSILLLLATSLIYSCKKEDDQGEYVQLSEWTVDTIHYAVGYPAASDYDAVGDFIRFSVISNNNPDNAIGIRTKKPVVVGKSYKVVDGTDVSIRWKPEYFQNSILNDLNDNECVLFLDQVDQDFSFRSVGNPGDVVLVTKYKKGVKLSFNNIELRRQSDYDTITTRKKVSGNLYSLRIAQNK